MWLQARPQLGHEAVARPLPGPTSRIVSYMALTEACLTVLRRWDDVAAETPLYRPTGNAVIRRAPLDRMRIWIPRNSEGCAIAPPGPHRQAKRWPPTLPHGERPSMQGYRRKYPMFRSALPRRERSVPLQEQERVEHYLLDKKPINKDKDRLRTDRENAGRSCIPSSGDARHSACFPHLQASLLARALRIDLNALSGTGLE